MSNSNETTVKVIDIPSLTVLEKIPDVGSYPFDLAFGPQAVRPNVSADITRRMVERT